jgi:hypothetical protein
VAPTPAPAAPSPPPYAAYTVRDGSPMGTPASMSWASTSVLEFARVVILGF